MEKLFICKDDTSSRGSGTAASKFWSFEEQGTDVLVKWGRLGLKGQEKLFPFSTETEMRRFIEKKATSKVRKGYALTDEKAKKKEEKIAKLMGTQHKILRMQWVSKKGKKLNFINNYDPKRHVYVEVFNSWSKVTTRLILSKGESFEIDGVAEASRVIEYDDEFSPDSGFVLGVREALKELARKVAAVVVRFAAMGVRKLSLTDDEEDEEYTAPVMPEIYKATESSGASKQVIQRFAALGNRMLDL